MPAYDTSAIEAEVRKRATGSITFKRYDVRGRDVLCTHWTLGTKSMVIERDVATLQKIGTENAAFEIMLAINSFGIARLA